MQGEVFPIYSCNSCTVMESVQGMHLDQTKEDLWNLQCVHSKAVASFFPDWEDHWTIDDLQETDMSYKVFCNPDIRIQTFIDQKRFLSAIQIDGEVTLMFTVGAKRLHVQA